MINLVRRCDLARDFATDTELRGTVRRLAGCPLGQRALREQACGYNHNKFNMLLEPRLDNIVYPITQKATDWMHCFFVHGVWNTVLYLVLMALVASGVAAAAAQDLHDFLLLWTLPGRLGASAQANPWQNHLAKHDGLRRRKPSTSSVKLQRPYHYAPLYAIGY
jgi:hypothetical protein